MKGQREKGWTKELLRFKRTKGEGVDKIVVEV